MSVDHLIAASLCGFAKLLTGVRALWLGSEPVARTRVYFANHRSHGDFVLIWASLPPALRRRTRPVAGADYWLTSPLRRFLINRVFHGVTIDRRPDRQGPNPVEQMGAALVAGDSLRGGQPCSQRCRAAHEALRLGETFLRLLIAECGEGEPRLREAV